MYSVVFGQHHRLLESTDCRYLKTTVNNIQLINKFQSTSEVNHASASREKLLYGFWMEFFIEGTKQESTGSQFPVCL